MSLNGMEYISKKTITFKEFSQIKDICKNYPSDHYMLTSIATNLPGININGSTIGAYNQTKAQQICSFIKYV